MSFFLGVFLVFVGQLIPTQIFAAMVGRAPWLGGAIGGVYVPGEYVWWLFVYKRPIQALPLPYVAPSPAIDAAFTMLRWTIPGSILLAIVIAIVVFVWQKARVGRAEDLYDSAADWGTVADATRLGLMEPAGIPLGFLDAPYGHGEMLRYCDDLGYEYTGPPGDGKSSLMQTMLMMPLQHAAARKWGMKQRRLHPYGEEPFILGTDPKIEYALKGSGYQTQILKKRVELLAPFGVPKTYKDWDGIEKPMPFRREQLACYNPLWVARLGQDDGYQDYYGKTRAIVDTHGKGMGTHWDDAGTGWGAALSEHLAFIALYSGNYELLSYGGMVDYLSAFREQEEEQTDPKTGKPIKVKVTAMDVMLRQMLAYEHDQTPDMRFKWTRVRTDGSIEATRHKPSIFNAANRMLAKDVRERSAVFSTWIEKLNLFVSDSLRRYSSSCTFEFKAVANDPKRSSTILIGANPMDLPVLQPFLRMVFEDYFRELTYGGTPAIDGRSARPNIYPSIALQEEAYTIGYNFAVDKGSGFIRGFGIYIMQLWQSIAQKQRVYNPDGRTDIISETFDVHAWGAAKTRGAADAVSHELGEVGRALTKENLSGDRWNVAPLAGVQEMTDVVEAPILRSKEFQNMPKTHYVLSIKGKNFVLRRPEYWRDKVMDKRSKMRPHLSSENTVAEPYFVRSIREVIGDDGMAEIVALRGRAPAGPEEPDEAEIATVTISNPIGVLGGTGDYVRVRARDAGEAFFVVREDAIAEEAAETAEEAVA